MATFAYTARDSQGGSTSGTLTAASVAEASQMLRAEGRYPVAIRPTAGSAAAGDTVGPRKGGRMSRAELIQVSTQLAVMVETGVTLLEALECIGMQSDRPNVRKVLGDVVEQLQGGTSLSEALERHSRSFPRMFIALVKASERSGQMSKMLNRAVAYLRDEADTMRRVRGALTYPGIMFGFAVTTTIFLLAFVLPRFTAIYANRKAALPAPTKALMAVSEFIVHDWMWILAGLAVVIGGAWAYLRTDGGKRVWHYVQLRIPLIGAMYRKLHLSRGLRMVGTMAGAGVSLIDCITTAHDLCPNTYFRQLWDRVSDQIQSGKQLSEPLFDSPLVPRAVSQMIHSGEKSGKLAGVMEQVATYAEMELREQITGLTRYIEPVMMVVMGLIIGGVAMALLLPIFTISRVMSGH